MTRESVPRRPKRRLLLTTAVALLGCALPSAARADWAYSRVGGDGGGTLTVSRRAGEECISLRQYCFALGCRLLYQWPNNRAVVRNADERLAAIISPLASFALVEGELVDFEGRVVVDEREGYMIPMPLAVTLAGGLKLGKVYSTKSDLPVQADTNNFKRELRTIVIDPGHGGTDFGTKSENINEKDITMFYAMKLRDELKRQMPDVKVILTREDDRYVSLPDRAKLANSSNASLFLSLHVNHAPDAKAEGVETYILSPDATDDEAKKTALLENDTWLRSAKIGDAGNDIRKILIDMEQEKYIQDSALVAAMIAQETGKLDATRGLKSRGVKQAMFYVLSQVAMPSTLVEVGFLSNSGDRGRMMNVEFRDDFVQSLVTALKRYAEPTRRK